MNWPSAVDYRDALQHPARVFSLPELRTCRVETNRLGVPRPRSGASAQVYKFFHAGGTIAVRLFLYPSDQREQRYQALHDHLAQVKAASLVGFSYHPGGISIGGERYPVLTMDWVEGIGLGEWVARKVRQGDLAALKRMAERWIALVQELRAARIGDGDLQHDNVMVVGDQLRLVDYDGMCVPRLVGADAFESGKPAYQHPRRITQSLSLELDHFAAWIIFLALRGIAAEPRLWQEHVEKTGNENLLFTEPDHFWPQRSVVWRQLLASPDAEVKAFAARLFATLPDRPFDTIPPFEIDPFESLRRACSATPPDSRAIVRLSPTVTARQSLPPELARLMEEAQRRMEARRELEDALKSGELRRIVSVYRPDLLDDWPDSAGLVLKARRAADVLRALDEMQEALRNPGDGRALVRLWSRHAARLLGVAEAVPIRQEVERWKARLDAWDQLLAALARNREGEIAAAWQRLQQAGGHPDADSKRERAELAVARSEALARLRVIPVNLPADEGDRLLLPAWEKEEALLRDCVEAEDLARRCETARERLRAWDRLETLIDRQGLERIDEAAAHPLLQDYPPFVAQKPRLRELLDRGPRVRRILERLEQGDPHTFDAAEDRDCLRDAAALFEPQRQFIISRTWDIADLRLSPLHPALQLVEPGRAIRVRWSWSAARRVRVCLLAVEGSRFLEVPPQARSLIRVEEADYRRGGGGFLIPVPLGGGAVHVTLWPILDLGWIELTGVPLHLGPLHTPEAIQSGVTGPARASPRVSPKG